jgi:hypothetical protein
LNEMLPVPEVTELRDCCVEGLFSVTFTPGIAALVLSSTEPERLALNYAWAQAGSRNRARTKSRPRARGNFRCMTTSKGKEVRGRETSHLRSNDVLL